MVALKKIDMAGDRSRVIQILLAETRDGERMDLDLAKQSSKRTYSSWWIEQGRVQTALVHGEDVARLEYIGLPRSICLPIIF